LLNPLTLEIKELIPVQDTISEKKADILINEEGVVVNKVQILYNDVVLLF